MKIEGVQCTDGKDLDLTMFEPKLIGYQIEHKETGRLLPSTTSFQVYGKVASTIKLLEVTETYKIAPEDYHRVPVYDQELEGSGVLIMHPLDHIFDIMTKRM